ncbi:MAG: hypothetical protein JO061_22895 [Acidobacteriaceae bacterium]|nr:hypothetical protein [Acidobacteriaceae bacterium]
MMRFFGVTGFCAACLCVSGQSIVFAPVQVSDISDRPIAHVVLSAKGDSSTAPPTDKAGKTHLSLPSSIAPGSPISLVLVDAPNASLKFLSPWEGHATIPLRDEIDVVLGVPGDPSMLNNAQVRQSVRGAIATNAAAAAGPKGPQGKLGPSAIQDALDKVSAEIGLKPDHVVGTLNRYAAVDASSLRHRRRAMATTEQGSRQQDSELSRSDSQMNQMQSRQHKH